MVKESETSTGPKWLRTTLTTTSTIVGILVGVTGLLTYLGFGPSASVSTARPKSRTTWMAESGKDQFGRWATFEFNGVRQRMRFVPAGSFQMGSPTTELGRVENEEQRPVALQRGLWLADTECTKELWNAVMKESPEHEGSPQHPAANRAWRSVQAFLQRINEKQPGLNLRLPSEAEWEYAARAGTTGARYGNLNAIAWHGGNSRSETHPVAQKQANAWGLYDMLGNVWEHTSDHCAGFECPQAGYRLLRGGAWTSTVAADLRAARRQPHPEDIFLEDGMGFRVARDPD